MDLGAINSMVLNSGGESSDDFLQKFPKAETMALIDGCVELGTSTTNAEEAAKYFEIARASVLLTFVASTPLSTVRRLQDRLLNYLLRTDAPVSCRVEAVGCVTALATKTLVMGWPKLWHNASSVLNDAHSDASGCRLFGIFVQLAAPYLAHGPLRANLSTLISGFEVVIMRTDDEEMVLDCIDGLAYLILSAREDIALLQQSTAIATMMRAAAQGTNRVVDKIFVHVTAFIEDLPECIPAHVSEIQRTVLAVMHSEAYDNDVKLTVARAVDALWQVDEKASQKQFAFITQYVQAVLAPMSAPTIELGDAWMNSYDDEKPGDDTPDRCAVILDMHCVTLRGAVMGPLLLTYIDKHGHSPRWQDRYAALLVMMVAFEGCQEECLTRMHGFLTDLIAPGLKDEHPLVRFTAVRCFAQLLIDLANTAHAKLTIADALPSICAIAATDPVGRLRAVAVLTLNTFFEGIEEDDYALFDELAFESMKAVAACARSADADYLRQYSPVTLATVPMVARSHMPESLSTLWPIYETYLNQSSRKIRCVTLECSSRLAAAMGVEAFGLDKATKICELLLQIQREVTSTIESDEMARRSLLGAWSYMADCMSAAAIQFIDEALPYILSVVMTPCALVEEHLRPGEPRLSVKGIDPRTIVVERSSSTLLTHLSKDLLHTKTIAADVIVHLVAQHGQMIQHDFEAIFRAAVELLSNVSGFHFSMQRHAATLITHIGDAYITAESADQLALFVAQVREPLISYVSQEPGAPEFGAALLRVMRAVLPDQMDDQLLDAASNVINHAMDLVLDTDDTRGCYVLDDEVLRRFDDAMQLCTVAVAKHSMFCDAFFIGTVLPDVGQLLDLSRPPFHHQCGLRLLECYVDAVPEKAVSQLSSIAESAAYFAKEASDPGVLNIAFKLNGKIAPMVATASKGSAAEEAGLMYATSIVEALNAFWERECDSHPAWQSSIDCATLVAGAFPAVQESVSLATKCEVL